MWDSLITNHFVPLLPAKWRLPFSYRRYCSAAGAEQELIHLQKIAPRFRAAVDIGANQGFYSYKMSRHFREVYAFETHLLVESKGHLDEVDSILEGLGYLRADFQAVTGTAASPDLYFYRPRTAAPAKGPG